MVGVLSTGRGTMCRSWPVRLLVVVAIAVGSIGSIVVDIAKVVAVVTIVEDAVVSLVLVFVLTLLLVVCLYKYKNYLQALL